MMVQKRPGGKVSEKATVKPAVSSTTRPQAARKQASGHTTSIDIPHYVMDQVRDYLVEHRDTKFRNLVLFAFTKIGIHVEEEDLHPQRKRRLL